VSGGAHAARVLVSAARRNDRFWNCDQRVCDAAEKFAIARRARQHAWTRALPGPANIAAV